MDVRHRPDLQGVAVFLDALCRFRETSGALEYETRIKTPWYALGHAKTATNAQTALAAYETLYPNGM